MDYNIQDKQVHIVNLAVCASFKGRLKSILPEA